MLNLIPQVPNFLMNCATFVGCYIFNAMETNNCSIAIYTAVGDSWCNIPRDSDEIVKKDETRV